MKLKVFSVTLFFLVLMISAVAISQGTVWVSSKGAKLKSESRVSSSTITELPVGTRLTVITSEGKWYKVSTGAGEKGWVYRGKITDTPPEKKEEDLFGPLLGSDVKVGAADSSRSIRGLSPEAKEYARKKGTSMVYQRALDRVLAMVTNESEIDRFLREGRVGEYAQ